MVPREVTTQHGVTIVRTAPGDTRLRNGRYGLCGVVILAGDTESAKRALLKHRNTHGGHVPRWQERSHARHSTSQIRR